MKGSNTGVYVGMMCDDWAQITSRDWDLVQTYQATGTSRAIVSNRVSYFFDWHGPSMTIDTACSSSLVAVHQAVAALRSGESPMAVVAGTNLILSPGKLASAFSRFLSPRLPMVTDKQECGLPRAIYACCRRRVRARCGMLRQMATPGVKVLPRSS